MAEEQSKDAVEEVLPGEPEPRVTAPAAQDVPSAQRKEVNQAGERRLARVEAYRALATVGVLVGHTWNEGHLYGPGTADTFSDRIIFSVGYGAYLLFWPFAKHYLAGGSRVTSTSTRSTAPCGSARSTGSR